MKEFTIDKEYRLELNSDNGKWDTYQNDNLLSKTADKLYKYYSLNLNNIDSLFRNYFYLANPGDFNDPFDCNVNLVEDVTNLEQLKTVKRNNYKNVGVTSFSETIDNHLMWAHYTDNYNGFVLEFEGNGINVKMPRETFEKQTLTRVIYPEKPVKIKKDYPFALHYVLTTKFKQWAYEKEWRIITELIKNVRTIEYYPEIVKAIYIGHKIPDNNKNIYELILEIQRTEISKNTNLCSIPTFN